LEFGSKNVLEVGIFNSAPKIQQFVPGFYIGTYSYKGVDPRPKNPRSLCWGLCFMCFLR